MSEDEMQGFRTKRSIGYISPGQVVHMSVRRNLHTLRELPSEARSSLELDRVSLWWRIARWILQIK